MAGWYLEGQLQRRRGGSSQLELSDQRADALRHMLTNLGPTFIKIGQAVSSRCAWVRCGLGGVKFCQGCTTCVMCNVCVCCGGRGGGVVLLDWGGTRGGRGGEWGIESSVCVSVSEVPTCAHAPVMTCTTLQP